MTALEALQKSMEMWQWLADHPDVSSKWVYLDWKLGRNDNNWPTNSCYICDYVLKSDNDYDCEGGCLIEWVPNHDFAYACEGVEESKVETTDEYNEYCCKYVEIQHETPYTRWSEAENDEERKAAALEVVKLHEEAIAKLEEDQNGTDKS